MAITFRSAANNSIGTTLSPASVNGEPAGTVQGDLLIMLMNSNAANAPQPPAGWTTIYSGIVTGIFYYNICYIVRGASAPSYSWTWTGGGSAYIELFALAFSGVSRTNPIDATGTLVSSTNGNQGLTRAASDIDPPSATSTVTAAMAVALGVHWGGSGAAGWTPPTGYTLRSNNAAGNNGMLASKLLGAAGAENPDEFYDVGNNVGTGLIAGTVLLRPAIEVDTTNSPIRFTGTWSSTLGGSITSAAFTAPANALLVLCAEVDTNQQNPAAGERLLSASDTGGLVWTKQIELTGVDAITANHGGQSAIFTARTTSAVSRTVSLLGNDTDSAAGTWGVGRASAKLYVVTGADVDGTPVDTVGANNKGSSTANNINTSSLTPGANGLLFAADADWSGLGGPGAVDAFDPSTDLTQNTTWHSGELTVCDGYKAVTSGVATTANLNGAGIDSGSNQQHKWCQIIVREGAATGGGEYVPGVTGISRIDVTKFPKVFMRRKF